jgi:hypothetical protein
MRGDDSFKRREYRQVAPVTEDSAPASAYPVVLGRPPVGGTDEDLDACAQSMVELMLGRPQPKGGPTDETVESG